MKRALIAVAAALAATGPAWAESGFYVGVEGGFAFFKDTADEEADSYLAQGFDTANVEQDRVAPVVRPFIGMTLTSRIDLEFGAAFFSRSMTVDGTYGPYRYKDTYEQSWRIFDYSVLLRPGASFRSRGFFVRIGGHSTTVDNDYRWTGSAYAQNGSQSVSENKAGAQLGLGYDWNLASGAFRLSGTRYANFPGVGEEDALTLVRVAYLFKF